jgi:hypothetical protein
MGLLFKKNEKKQQQVNPCQDIFDIFPGKECIWEICLNVRNKRGKEIFDDIYVQKMNRIKTPDKFGIPNSNFICTC